MILVQENTFGIKHISCENAKDFKNTRINQPSLLYLLPKLTKINNRHNYLTNGVQIFDETYIQTKKQSNA
jgi:hypothetical protein